MLKGKHIDGNILYEKLLEKRIDTEGESIVGVEQNGKECVLFRKHCFRGKLLWKDTLKREILETSKYY